MTAEEARRRRAMREKIKRKKRRRTMQICARIGVILLGILLVWGVISLIHKLRDNKEQKENMEHTFEKPVDPIEYPTPSETATNAGYKINNNTYMYNFTLGSTVAGTISKLQTANQYASINITNSSNTPKTSGSLVTGDKITIVSDGVSQTYVAIIYGDTNGDSEITTLDLLIVQRHLLKKTTLTNAYFKAADVNKDGSVTTLDLLIIQKHLLKKSNISQS